MRASEDQTDRQDNPRTRLGLSVSTFNQSNDKHEYQI